MRTSKEFELAFDLKPVLQDCGVEFIETDTHFILKVCPNCSGRSKLYVDRREKFWVCFKCVKTNDFTNKQGRGNLITLLRLLGLDEPQIRSLLKDGEVKHYSDPDMFHRQPEPQKRKAEVAEIYLPPSFLRLDGTVDNVRTCAEAYRYLICRGVKSMVRIKEFDLRYSMEMKRLIFPVYQDASKVVGWQGRDVTERWKKDHWKCGNAECSLVHKWYFIGEEDRPSSGRCPECGELLDLNSYTKSRNSKNFPKTELFFNQHNVDWSKPVVMVEGPFDCISTPNSVALLGKVLSQTQVNILLARKPPMLILYLDGDDAGRLSTHGTIDQVGCFFDQLRVVPLEDGQDPGSFTLELNEVHVAGGHVSASEWQSRYS